jgi:hypothetical protein
MRKTKNRKYRVNSKWPQTDIPDVYMLPEVTVAHKDRAYYYPFYITQNKMGDCVKDDLNEIKIRGIKPMYQFEENIVCELMMLMRDFAKKPHYIYFRFDASTKKTSYYIEPRADDDGRTFTILLWSTTSTVANVLDIDIKTDGDQLYIEVLCPRDYDHSLSSLITSVFDVTRPGTPNNIIYDSCIQTIRRAIEYCQLHRESENLFVKSGAKQGGSLRKIDLTYAIDIFELLRYGIIKRSYRPKKVVVHANNLLAITGQKRKREE